MVLVIKEYRFLAILVIKRVWFLQSSLELGKFILEEITFSSFSLRPSTNALDTAVVFLPSERYYIHLVIDILLRLFLFALPKDLHVL